MWDQCSFIVVENTIPYNDKKGHYIQIYSVHIKVNDLDYSGKPDDTLKAKERGIQLVT